MREASKAIGSLAKKALGLKRQEMQGLSGSTNMRVYASLLIASMLMLASMLARLGEAFAASIKKGGGN